MGSVLFQNLKKLTIFEIQQLQLLKFIYRSVHKLLPKTLKNIFQEVSNIHDHNTRGKTKLFTRQARLNARKNSITVQGPILWNTVPQNIQNASSLKQFGYLYKRAVFLK